MWFKEEIHCKNKEEDKGYCMEAIASFLIRYCDQLLAITAQYAYIYIYINIKEMVYGWCSKAQVDFKWNIPGFSFKKTKRYFLPLLDEQGNDESVWVESLWGQWMLWPTYYHWEIMLWQKSITTCEWSDIKKIFI